MEAVSTYRPARLVPVTSPVALRERTVRDYVRNAERAGIDVPVRSLERLAVHDCQMADAYERGVDRSPPRPKPTKRPPRIIEPKDELDLAMKAAPTKRDPEATYADFVKISSRWPWAMGRMRRIIAGATPNRDPLLVAVTCEIPELAIATIRLHRNYLMRNRDSRHNPFRGLSDYDARRALVRAVEDICDRSSGHPGFGPWWVPR